MVQIFTRTPAKGKSSVIVIILEPQQKEQLSVMFKNIETQKKEQSFVIFMNQFPTIHQTNVKHEELTWIQSLYWWWQVQWKKPALSQGRSTNLWGKKRCMSSFGYIQMKICNHTQGQVSGSIHTDPINLIHARQQSTK